MTDRSAAGPETAAGPGGTGEPVDGTGLKGLRVALVLGTSAGGVGRHVRSVASGLAARGARVVVCGPADTGRTFGFERDGVRFAPIDLADRPRPVTDARAVARLRGLLRGADVVHAHGLRAGGLSAAACARVAAGPLRMARGGGPPLVVTLHNAVITGGRTAVAYGALERVVALGADEVLGVSPDLEDRMRSLGARTVAHALVPAPVPRAQPSAAVRADLRAELGVGERPLILTVGRLAEQKGLPTLLDASKGWARRTPPPLVAIVGNGPLEETLRARIEREELPVRLLGRRGDVPALLSAADVTVVPSVWEGQPLIVQEILRTGRPLVATRVGGVPQMVGAVRGGGTGGDRLVHGPESEAALLVPPGDPAALERAVSRVLDDPALAVRLGAAAARRATFLPGESDAVDQLAGIYLRLTSAPRR